MLVPYEPYFAFDVHRSEKECISCGKEESLTIQKGKNRGYCNDCLNAKRRFCSAIVGSIELNKDVDNLIITMLEATRVKMMGDRISYMVDEYFVTHPDGDPFNDIDFLIRCYHDKTDVLAEFSAELNSIIEQAMKSNRGFSFTRVTVESAYVRYYHGLGMMNAANWNTINELCQKREEIRAEAEQAASLKLQNNDGN